MSPCESRLEALQEADIGELSGSGDSDLARHIRSCARCRAAAEDVIAAVRSLDSALNSTAEPDVDALLARARMRPLRGAVGVLPLSTRRWSMLAAAAAIGAIMLGRGERPLPGDTPLLLSTASVAFDVPTGRDVAVLQTDNPNITVLWFFQED